MELERKINYLNFMSTEIFQVSFFIYLTILLAENFKKGIISDFLNLNWVLVIVILSGILMVLCDKEKDKEEIVENKTISWKKYLLMAFLAVFSAVLIWIKINSLGWPAFIISILGGAIIFLVSYLISNER